MIDPGALGTLVIGLRATRAELDAQLDAERCPSDARPIASPTRRAARAAMARALRGVADRLEPAPWDLESAR
jgi:hypothetical protein